MYYLNAVYKLVLISHFCYGTFLVSQETGVRLIDHNELQVIAGGEVNAERIGLVAGAVTLGFTIGNGVREGIVLGGGIGNIAAGVGAGLLVGGFAAAVVGISTWYLAYLAGFDSQSV